MAREDSLTAGLNQIRISPSHSNANSLSTLQPVGSASSISEIHEKRFPSWLSSVANGVMKNFDMVDHRKVQPVLHEESSDSEDEEEETSQEKLSSLLWEAQMELVNHNVQSAIFKLNKAYQLNSSAAALTLGNLFARGLAIRATVSSPPATAMSLEGARSFKSFSPSSSSSENESSDGLTSANWFILGLEIEENKPIQPQSSIRHEEDNHEGSHFSCERILDLTLGLTEAYKFGVLHHDRSGGGRPGISEVLWRRGQEVATRLLDHPGIASPLQRDSASAFSPPLVRSAGGPISIPASLPSRHLIAPSPRTTSRSPRRQPTITTPVKIDVTPAAKTPTPASPLLSPVAKLRLAIKLNLLYLLALSNWLIHRERSEMYWQGIVDLATDVGGVVGTREGDEIVQKALKRLRQIDGTEAKVDWRVTQKGQSGAASSPEGMAGSLRKGDALSEIGTLNHLEKDGWTATHGDDASTATPRLTSPFLTSVAGDNTGPSNLAGSKPASLQDAALHNSLEYDVSASLVLPPLPPTTATPRSSKFHFAEADYPSPPASPSLEPISSPLPNDSPRSSPSLPSPPAPPPIGGRLLRLSQSPSFYSFRPPPVLFRTKSSASVSTLPPDFFSTYAKRSLLSSTLLNPTATATAESTFDYDFLGSPTNPQLTWRQSFRARATSKLRRLTPFLMNVPRGHQGDAQPRAVSSLLDLLARDDNCGMYWGDDVADQSGLELGSEEEREEEPSEVEAIQERVLTRTMSTSTSTSTRAFVDPTSSPLSTMSTKTRLPSNAMKHLSSPARSSPLAPQSYGLSFSPSPPRLSTPFPAFRPTSPRPTLVTLSTESSIDPLLLALERASRVGMKTKCASCSKKGLNFPCCPKCERFYCSRECRIGAERGGGDGIRHVCEKIVLSCP